MNDPYRRLAHDDYGDRLVTSHCRTGGGAGLRPLPADRFWQPFQSAPSRSVQGVLGLRGQRGNKIGCGRQVGDEVDGLARPHR
ncbi:hypothetical protein Pth03_76780 [Planotetraspora thailandica]|uniref:Uncharacterized protein n=1 Tax=Planotetraspora thailandica TaxID=487172 RepID=A0A8J3Y1X6_9ACTN|nr:hypothetical protein Pth03_76780 [Planotetraspora thailandica]